MITALLPIKQNSQRVPGKNFKFLGDKQLYRWVLDTLLSLSEVDLVVINTDSEVLLEDKQLRDDARVMLRERVIGLRGDEVSMNSVLADDVENLAGEIFLMTHATNPFLTASTFRRAINLFVREVDAERFDSLFSVNRVQARLYYRDASPLNHDPCSLIQTQDLEPLFEENSCLYLFTRESFRRAKARIGSRPVMFETPPLESLDIDTSDDWSMAEALAFSVPTIAEV